MQSADKARCNIRAIGMGIAKGKVEIAEKMVFWRIPMNLGQRPLGNGMPGIADQNLPTGGDQIDAG
jgi:hypothetical protein